MILDPFDELRRMQSRINRLFEELEKAGLTTISPITEFPVDVIDEGDKVRVIADLPGFSKEDIQIYSEGDYLIIKAVRKEEKDEKTKDYIRKERKFGEVYRRVALPSGLDFEKAKASYNNGILEVIIPRSSEARKEIKLE